MPWFDKLTTLSEAEGGAKELEEKNSKRKIPARLSACRTGRQPGRRAKSESISND
jgi:hypothetical protein